MSMTVDDYEWTQNLSHCFRRSHLTKDFAVLEVYCLHTPSVTVNCCWLLPNFEL